MNSDASDSGQSESENTANEEDWTCIGDFKDIDECTSYMQKTGKWIARKRAVQQHNGSRTNWFCNECKSRGPQCAARFFSLHKMPNEDPAIYRLFRREAEHNHTELNNLSTKITEQAKTIIETCIDNGFTLKYAMAELRKIKPDKMPLKNQVKNYIKQYRRKKFGDPAVSIEDLIEFCQENLEVPDDDNLDKPYVIAFEHSPILGEDSDEEENDGDEEEKWFRYIVTTKRLLHNAKGANIIHADATNKITVQKYPLLVFGATDKTPDQKFHLIAIMISKHEASGDFEFAFKAIRNAMLYVTDTNFSPEYLMADAATAIANGFRGTFGDAGKTILMCESHMKRVVDRHKFHDQSNREPIKSDLNKLKLAYSEAVFDQGCGLFVEKWAPKELELVKCIDEWWFHRHHNWFDGAGIRTPTTNNALEGFNGVFKSLHTRRKISNLAEFKIKLMNIMQIESEEFQKDKEKYTNDVTLSKNVMKDGLAYSKIKHIEHRVENESVTAYMKRGDLDGTFTLDDVDNHFYRIAADEPKTFDEWSENLFRFYIISVDPSPINWKNSVCTCPAFAARFICKHVTCLAYYLGFIKEPKRTLLTANRPKGRPKNASQALAKE